MPFLFIITLLTFILGIPASLAAETNSDSQNSKKSLNINDLAGLYTNNHKTGFVGDEKLFDVTDVLEIVPYDEQSAYVRMRLKFYNGHRCSLYGVAKLEEQRLVYIDDRLKELGRICVLDIIPDDARITFSDKEGHCQMATCGMRGGYQSQYFLRSKKRKITYMEKLKNSKEYKQSVEAYKARFDTISPAEKK